mmetsp:Transcript_80188/g.227037  ORF Transcript_80188/g.227037 Transcript_80188/m.227037 type:complete len:218 (+) Transcript_80188:96-749(+)
MPASSFQVKIRGYWEDFQPDEDKILKHAFKAGFPVIVYTHREQPYRCDFKKMTKRNIHTSKVYEIRPPFKFKSPSSLPHDEAAIFVLVEPHTEGTTIQVHNPENEKRPIFVAVPENARIGQAMLVPIVDRPAHHVGSGAAMPLRTKAALATSGFLAVGGLAVAGLILGDVMTGGSAMEEIGDGGATVARHIGEGLNDFASAVDDVTDATGDLVTQLF